MDEQEDFSKGVLGEINDTLRPLFIHVIRYPECDGNILTIAVYDTKRKEVQMRAREKKPDSQGMHIKTAVSEWQSLPTPRAVKDFQRQGRRGFESVKRELNLDGQFIELSPTISHEELMRTLRTSDLFNIREAM